MTEAGEGTLRITLVRSTIGRPGDQGRTVASLGLRRLHATVERPDCPSIRGMVTKVRHLVRVEEIPAESSPRGAEKKRKHEDETPSDA